MDGRPHPPEYAPHTFMGFSTGEWNGDILTITTTHIKAGLLPPQRHPRTAIAPTVVEHWMRHGNVLSQVTIATDPVYLTEPYIRSQEFVLMERGNTNWLYNCEYAMEVPTDKNEVPHFLPAEPVASASSRPSTRCREGGVRGGAETLLPDWQSGREAAAPAAPRTPTAASARSISRRSCAAGEVQGGPRAGQRPHDRRRRREHRRAGRARTACSWSTPARRARATRCWPRSRQLAPDKEIRWIVNTTFRPDHIGGNEPIVEGRPDGQRQHRRNRRARERERRG